MIDAGWMRALAVLGPDLTPKEWAAKIDCDADSVRVALVGFGTGTMRPCDRRVLTDLIDWGESDIYTLAKATDYDRAAVSCALNRLRRGGAVTYRRHNKKRMWSAVWADIP